MSLSVIIINQNLYAYFWVIFDHKSAEDPLVENFVILYSCIKWVSAATWEPSAWRKRSRLSWIIYFLESRVQFSLQPGGDWYHGVVVQRCEYVARVEAHKYHINEAGEDVAHDIVEAIRAVSDAQVEACKPEYVNWDTNIRDGSCQIRALKVPHSRSLSVIQWRNYPENLRLSPQGQVHDPLEIIMLASLKQVVISSWCHHNGDRENLVNVECILWLDTQKTLRIKVFDLGFSGPLGWLGRISSRAAIFVDLNEVSHHGQVALALSLIWRGKEDWSHICHHHNLLWHSLSTDY